MKRNISIQLKAALLLAVFGLNTAVGFACAIGMDMSFNTPHHDEAVKVSVHNHADGKKHEHRYEPVKHHDEENSNVPKKEKGDCCNDKVINFQSLDKNLNQNAKTVIDVPVFAAILNGFFGINIFKAVPVALHKYIVPTSHPPPPDIRIVIQSFQI